MPASLEMHIAMLESVQADRDRIAVQLAEIDTVERFHKREIERLGGNTAPAVTPPTSIPTPEQVRERGRVVNLPKHEAAALVMREIGHDCGIPEIVNRLLDRGYGHNLKRQNFSNSLFTAINRNKKLFTKKGRGTYSLKEWEGQKSNGKTP